MKQPNTFIQTNKILEKYKELRIRLDDLNYKYYFDISSIQLIDSLVCDLSKLKKENPELKLQLTNLEKENENLKIGVRAFKSENNQLVNENNQIRNEIIESKKKAFSSQNAKEIELINLSEEKESFKFLYLKIREKLTKIEKENEELKKRHLNLISKVYENNMSEMSLRRLYESEINIVNSNKIFENSNSELGIIVKHRGMDSSSNLNINLSNSLNQAANLNSNKKDFKEIIQETFGKNYQRINSENCEEKINSLSLSLKKELNEKILQLQKGNYELNQEICKLKSKNNLLENRLALRHKEPNLENTPIDLNSVVEFLKKEKGEIIEKYEKRIEILMNEKNFTNFNCKETKYTTTRKFLNNQENKLKNSEEEKSNHLKVSFYNTSNKTENLIEILNRYKSENLSLKVENENLQNAIKNYQLNYIDKKILTEKEEELSKRNSQYRAFFEDMNLKLKEASSVANSERSIHAKQHLEEKEKISKLQKEKEIFNFKLQKKDKEISELEDQINSLNLKLLLKDKIINEISGDGR